MADVYSTYEAKARFSEVIRKVRGGKRVVVEYHGEPVAEILPIAAAPQPFNRRIASLERAGVVAPRSGGSSYRPVARRPGALKRFLAERE
jgi:prevent-host-death family protein